MSHIRVDVIKSKLPRRQKYRWVAKAANNRTVAISGEWFTNKADLWHSVLLVFSDAEVSGWDGVERLPIREAR